MQQSSYKLQDAAAQSDEPLNEPSPNPEIDDDSRVMFVMFREHCLRRTHLSTTAAAYPPRHDNTAGGVPAGYRQDTAIRRWASPQSCMQTRGLVGTYGDGRHKDHGWPRVEFRMVTLQGLGGYQFIGRFNMCLLFGQYVLQPLSAKRYNMVQMPSVVDDVGGSATKVSLKLRQTINHGM